MWAKDAYAYNFFFVIGTALISSLCLSLQALIFMTNTKRQIILIECRIWQVIGDQSWRGLHNLSSMKIEIGGVTEATHQTIYGLYRCSPSCISGLSRIIAAWRPILTKDKSRWRKYFTKKQILKKCAFQQWLLRPRYCHGVFATSGYFRLFAQKKAYQGGDDGHPGPPPPQLRPWQAVYFVIERVQSEEPRKLGTGNCLLDSPAGWYSKEMISVVFYFLCCCCLYFKNVTSLFDFIYQ